MSNPKADEQARVAHRRRGRSGVIGWLWRWWYDSGQTDYRTRRVVAGAPPRSYSTPNSYCARCLRAAPRAIWDPSVPADPTLSDPRLPEWELITDGQGGERLLCPDCLAREEREQWAKADAALDEERKRPGRGVA
jgi:hypothetical protein